jgi:hypothetical protein
MTGELIPTGVTFGVGRNSINDAFSGTAEFNNISLDSGGDFSGGTGGGVIYSGNTDLYSIFATQGESSTASNGLTKTGDNITLGGSLTGGTVINGGGSYSLTIKNATQFQLDGTPFDVTGGDVSINNSSLYLGNAVDFSGGTGAGVIYSGGTDLYNIFATSDSTTASNGLTKTGDNITLGGTLTAATTINLDPAASLNIVKTAGTGSVLSASDGAALNSAFVPGRVGVGDNTASIGMSMDISQSGISYSDTFIGGGTQILKFIAPSSFTTETISLPQDKSGIVALTSDVISTTASNGLTKTGDNITLGGTLTAATTIDTGGNNLTFIDTDVTLQMSTSTDVKRLQITGSASTLTQFSTSANMPSFGGFGSLAIGVIGDSAVIGGIVPERGQTGDTFIYSSANANGLNVISAAGTGTDDYIRLYAGIFANGGTAHLHMQGSGLTKGYIGLNNESPQYRLDVNGDINSDGVIYSAGTDLYSIFGAGGSGESNTASSVGVGNSVFKQKSGVDLEFRSLSAGTNIELVTGDTITINVTGVTSSEATYDFGTTSGIVDWDLSTISKNAKLRFGGNITALNVLNASSGDFGTLLLEQSTGSHTITLGAGTHRVVNSGGGAITLTATASARDIISFFYDGSTFYWNVGNDYT